MTVPTDPNMTSVEVLLRQALSVAACLTEQSFADVPDDRNWRERDTGHT